MYYVEALLRVMYGKYGLHCLCTACALALPACAIACNNCCQHYTRFSLYTANYDSISAASCGWKIRNDFAWESFYVIFHG